MYGRISLNSRCRWVWAKVEVFYFLGCLFPKADVLSTGVLLSARYRESTEYVEVDLEYSLTLEEFRVGNALGIFRLSFEFCNRILENLSILFT